MNLKLADLKNLRAAGVGVNGAVGAADVLTPRCLGVHGEHKSLFTPFSDIKYTALVTYLVKYSQGLLTARTDATGVTRDLGFILYSLKLFY